MWLVVNKTLDNKQKLLEAGKALCLCQKFEITCKDICMWLSLSKSLNDEKFEFLSDEHSQYVDKLLKLLLGQSINEFEKKFKIEINATAFEIIKKAKESRNFICHELLKSLISASFSDKQHYKGEVAFFKNHLRNIAKGDYLVSKWSYEFHERESGDFYDEQNYISKILEWVEE